MKLTIREVFDATMTIAVIMRENRPMPQKGKYRLARAYAKLKVEYDPIAVQHDEMIRSFGGDAVPEDKMEEFIAKWNEFASGEIEVGVEPIPFEQLDLGDDENGAITAHELFVLAPFIREPAGG